MNRSVTKHDTLASLMQMERPPSAASLSHPTRASNESPQPHTAAGVWSYRSSLNLKWKENDGPTTTTTKSTSSVALRRPSSAASSTQGTVLSRAPTAQAKRSEAETCVLWRECKSETMVRREAIFYNFLLNHSDPRTTLATSTATATSHQRASTAFNGLEDDSQRTLQKRSTDDGTQQW